MGEVTLSLLVVGPFQSLLPAQTALGRERFFMSEIPLYLRVVGLLQTLLQAQTAGLGCLTCAIFARQRVLYLRVVGPFQTLLPAQNTLGREHADLGRRLTEPGARSYIRAMPRALRRSWGVGFDA